MTILISVIFNLLELYLFKKQQFFFYLLEW